MAHILIVEDDAHSAKLLNVRLAHLGHTIMVAQDGNQAFACIQAQAPDLILLDVMLPRISGFQVLEQLKLNRTTNRIPVLMLTVRTDEQSIRTGIEGGADAYLSKPIDFPDLVQRIETCLRRSTRPALRTPHDG
jgi:two-component system alkaline phosphatase synthesis response regulator PhoP